MFDTLVFVWFKPGEIWKGISGEVHFLWKVKYDRLLRWQGSIRGPGADHHPRTPKTRLRSVTKMPKKVNVGEFHFVWEVKVG